MPIPLQRAVLWASKPETLRLVHELAEAPEDNRRAQESALLRSASRLLGLPKGWMPSGADRAKALIWLVGVHTEILRRVIEAKEAQDSQPQTDTPTT